MAEAMTRRAMFVWLPNFEMIRARSRRPSLAGLHEPLVLVEKYGNIQRIAALDAPALAAGLYRHQPLADALAILPGLVAADAEPEASQAALRALAFWARRYSPATAAAFPDGLRLDVTGCAHLWGGETRLCEDLLARLQEKGIAARAAIAETHGAAFAIAHHAEDYAIVAPGAHAALLSHLPVERLRILPETASLLRKLGLLTIGQVQNLPRSDLASRFPGLLSRLDAAMGCAAEVIDVPRPPPPFLERWRFAEPISAPEDLERAVASLLTQLCARLERARLGATHFEAGFFRADGGAQSIAIAAALPARDPARLLCLFREKLGGVDPGFGIDAVEVAGRHTEPLAARQIDLPGPASHRRGMPGTGPEELAELIDKLSNRLGAGRVYRMAFRESHLPERVTRRVHPLSGNPLDLKGAEARHVEIDRPIRFFAEPRPIEVTAALPDAPPILFRWHRMVYRIRRSEGPERISPEWWRVNATGRAKKEDETRDYYRVETMEGLRFWVYRQGRYGATPQPRWYLHGAFG